MLKGVSEDLKAQPNVPIEKALPETLGRLWAVTLKDATAAELRKIVEESKGTARK